jgi:hypothetical protein
MKNLISRAIVLLRTSPSLEDEALYRALVADGMEREFAARLVEFLPLAYGRLVLANSGILFSDALEGALGRQNFSEGVLVRAALGFGRGLRSERSRSWCFGQGPHLGCGAQC